MKVPVDGATGDAGRLGNIAQRGARDAFGMKALLGSVENAFTGFKGFFFGASYHGESHRVGGLWRPAQDQVVS